MNLNTTKFMISVLISMILYGCEYDYSVSKDGKNIHNFSLHYNIRSIETGEGSSYQVIGEGVMLLEEQLFYVNGGKSRAFYDYVEQVLNIADRTIKIRWNGECKTPDSFYDWKMTCKEYSSNYDNVAEVVQSNSRYFPVGSKLIRGEETESVTEKFYTTLKSQVKNNKLR